MVTKKTTKGGSFTKFISLFLLAILLGGGIYIYLVYFEKTPPSAQLEGKLEYLSKQAIYAFTVKDEATGLRSVRLFLRQGDKEYVMFEKEFSRAGYGGKMGPASFAETVAFDYEKSGLENGEAQLILAVNDYSLRNGFSGNSKEIEYNITIDTKPPKIRLLHAERYIRSGGSGIVIYEVDGDAESHGAEIGGFFHGGHPLGNDKKNVYIAYIALPYDAEGTEASAIIAEDAAGNSIKYPFTPTFKKVPLNRDKINVGDGFLSAKIPEFSQYYPEIAGNQVEKFVQINSRIRRENNAEIQRLCASPLPERLWKDKFLRMAGASMAGYADHRTYFYQNKEIDQQVHLGMDIASTRRAEVKAGNTGKVIYADYLGIYGNMVLLDHGQGVFSLYSHLSRIDVVVGDTIQKGTVLGHTGKTGMAGGDHLHFSMLINGIFVTPKEWLDQQWINVTIDGPLRDSKF